MDVSPFEDEKNACDLAWEFSVAGEKLDRLESGMDGLTRSRDKILSDLPGWYMTWGRADGCGLRMAGCSGRWHTKVDFTLYFFYRLLSRPATATTIALVDRVGSLDIKPHRTGRLAPRHGLQGHAQHGQSAPRGHLGAPRGAGSTWLGVSRHLQLE